ncbi:MAG: hypothetical protein P1V20_24965 [Verrucomicrobiales bacterium]|nr:hypothetical protein [Verrucomicrobiales bacterium]
MDETLQYCSEKFGRPPRKFYAFARWGYLRIPYPDWVLENHEDPLLALWGGMPRLRKEGIITWGYVVQANSLLYAKGTANYSGLLVYSIEDPGNTEPGELKRVADSLYQLKETTPDDEGLKPLARFMEDGFIRIFGFDVPASISPNLKCQLSSTVVTRKHLPEGFLKCSLMPILVLPDDPQIAMPLPSRYWPGDFIDWWQEDDSKSTAKASDPGEIPLCHKKLRLQRPELYGLAGLIGRIRARLRRHNLERRHIEWHLMNGDSRAAVVISVSPLMVAAYTDELDCIAMLRFDDDLNLVDAYGLRAGSRLLTVNTYADLDERDSDLFPGPEDRRRWSGFTPIIADFLTEDENRVAKRKLEIPETEWQRTAELGKEYAEKYPGVARDGRALNSYYPADMITTSAAVQK